MDILARHRLLACGFPEFAAAGGLMAYGVDLPEMDRRAAVFVDKILRVQSQRTFQSNARQSSR